MMDGTPMNGQTAYVQHMHKHDHGHEHDHDYEKDVAYAHSGDGGKGMLEGLLLGMCQKQGIDPGLIALMKDKEHDGLLGGGSGLLVLLFLIILLGGRGFGFGRDGHDGCRDGGHGHGFGGGYGGPGIVNQIDFKVLLDAIERKGLAQEIAMKELATNLHVSFDSVKMAIANLDKGHALVEGRLGHMDSSLKCAIKECCCEMRLAVERSTGILSKEICETNHNIDNKFCGLERRMDDKFCNLERRMDNHFCETDKLIRETNYDNLIREQKERIEELKARAFESSQNEQTAKILTALRCEPRRHCFDERPRCRDFDERPPWFMPFQNQFQQQEQSQSQRDDQRTRIDFAPVFNFDERTKVGVDTDAEANSRSSRR